MSNHEGENLDRLAAKYAQEVIRHTAEQKAKDVDNTVTKALGVLQENGIYACALFLKSRSKEEKPRADAVMTQALNLLDSLGFGWGQPGSSQSQAVLQHVADTVMADRLERVLLAKETLEQMLVYARYGAKARVPEEE